MRSRNIWLIAVTFLFFISLVSAVQASCSSNIECNDNNTLTFDECINPDTTISQCRNTPINCAANIDCGSTGFLGNPYCSESDLFKNFQNSSCVNPGTLDSFCTVTITSNLFEQCSNGCENNQCIQSEVACSSNLDCGTDHFIGQEFCSENNVTKNFISFTCNSPGTTSSFCTDSTTSQTIQECSDICSNGSCVTITCHNDADCDDSNNSTQDICVNPGTIESSCNHITEDILSIHLLSPAEAQIFSLSIIPLQFLLTGEAENCFYILDSNDSISIPDCNNSTSFNASEGNHSIEVFANNSLALSSDSNSFKVDLSPPSINLDSPQNQAVLENVSPVSFRYTASDFSGLSSCTFWNDFSGHFSPQSTHNSVSSGVQDTFTLSVTPGNYTWNILCIDNALHQSFAPLNYTLMIKQAEKVKNKVHGSGLTDEEINITSRQFIKSEYYAPFQPFNSASNLTNTGKTFLNNPISEYAVKSSALPLLIVILLFLAILLISLLIVIFSVR